MPETWDKLWESRHHVMSRLTQYFNVLWVNPAQRFPAKSSAPPFSDGVDSRFRPQYQREMAIYQPESWLPNVRRPMFVGSYTGKQRLQRARQLLQKEGAQKTVLYIWRPQYGNAVDQTPYDLCCYHLDDEYNYSKVEQPLHPIERFILTRADMVIMTSPGLVEKKARYNPFTHMVPNGVDFRRFSTQQPEPDVLKQIPGPRIGYVGKVREHIDVELVASLAKRQPDKSFIFVGPCSREADCRAMQRYQESLPNFFFLDIQPFDLLPAFMQHMDVLMLCYEKNAHTNYIYPLKMHEYLASGTPVISTDIRSVHEFRHVIYPASSIEEWESGLERLLSDSVKPPGAVEARQKVARDHDWGLLVNKIASNILTELNIDYSGRIRQFENVTKLV